MFAYSAENIRIFVPANDTGSLIHIPENWGTQEYNQISNNVQIIVSIWTTVDTVPCKYPSATDCRVAVTVFSFRTHFILNVS